jgi:hypothetical protein
LIHYFRELGFEGLYSGGKHEFMIKGHNRVYIPNPHSGDISRDLLPASCNKQALAEMSGNSFIRGIAMRQVLIY